MKAKSKRKLFAAIVSNVLGIKPKAHSLHKDANVKKTKVHKNYSYLGSE